SNIHLNNLIICQKGRAFSLDHGQIGLEKDDFSFLERFLDATKARLFFAKGVILVEGDAENILLPAIAAILDRPLHKYGVSIVNVGSKALLRYAKIFRRHPDGTLPIKVSILTDLDIEQVNPTPDVVKTKKRKTTGKIPDIDEESTKLKQEFNSQDGHIKIFHSPLWTMEYDIALGDFAPFTNCATYVAQLAKSRANHQNFKGIGTKEAVERIKKAKELYTDWQNTGLSREQIAFKIYERLKN